MIRSMTGYGRAQQQLSGKDITVEIKSVNHRFFEFSARTPRAYGYLDDKLKALVQTRVARGKVEVGVTILSLGEGDTEVQINTALAQEYLHALREMGRALGIEDDVTISTMVRFGDIFAVRRAVEDEDAVWSNVKAVAEEAVARFVEMRETEGRRLKDDLLGRLAAIEEKVGRVERRSPQTMAEYRARLTSRLQEALTGVAIDEQRVLTEAAIVAERLAVDEETVRLRSHIGQFRQILELPEPVGRKLDFLVQELNREANTIGSKAQDIEIAQVVVEMKSEIEKIREQIQNIE